MFLGGRGRNFLICLHCCDWCRSFFLFTIAHSPLPDFECLSKKVRWRYVGLYRLWEHLEIWERQNTAMFLNILEFMSYRALQGMAKSGTDAMSGLTSDELPERLTGEWTANIEEGKKNSRRSSNVWACYASMG